MTRKSRIGRKRPDRPNAGEKTVNGAEQTAQIKRDLRNRQRNREVYSNIICWIVVCTITIIAAVIATRK